jgi:hypothetical protein
MPFRWKPNGAFLTVGYAHGFPVCEQYHPPFPFTGSLERVVLTTGEMASLAPERVLRMQRRHQ